MKNNKFYIVTALIFVAVISGLFIKNNPNILDGIVSFGVSPYEQPRLLSTGTIEVGPDQVKTVFSARADCSSRVISAYASPLMISLGSTVTPSGTAGHPQAATTTVSYNAEDYGCGAFNVYAYSTTTITYSEFIF